MAQMRYTDAVATLDVEVLVIVPEPDRLDLLAPLYEFCRDAGFAPDGEAIRVGGWPLQLIPAYNALTREAVEEAETVDFQGVALRVVSAGHLAAIALSVGRAKDLIRILSLLESGAVTGNEVAALAARHGMRESWSRFVARFLDA